MKAIRIEQTGGPEVMQLVDVDLPPPGPGEIRIRHTAIGLNFIDTYHRGGLYPMDYPFTPGLEGAGTVIMVGDGVEGFSAGDRVGWLNVLGSYSEKVVVPTDKAIPIPDEVGTDLAAAVLLHEAVAHALEADVLAQGGDPEMAVGVEMASPLVSVLDDPAAAPEGVRRTSDDEGVAVERRWLLRDGRVSQPLADALWARGSNVLTAGAGRRGDRHAPPDPRSTHLELLAGETAEADLAADADGGLWLPEARRGRLDPLTGTFRLELPFGRRIRSGQAAEPVGPCVLVGSVADLLSRVSAVAAERRAGGAGWCAKGGRKLPVWATTPAIRLDGVAILPGAAGGGSE